MTPIPILMGYNTDAFKGRPAPQSWADFWNVEKFPGGRAVFDKPRYMLEFATLADGVPKDKLYPIDIDRAFRKLDELKPHITLFFRQFDQARQLLATGAVTMSVASPAVISEAKRQGAPVEMVWNQGVVAYDYLTIPKGTKNKSAAMKYIAWYANNGEAQAKDGPGLSSRTHQSQLAATLERGGTRYHSNTTSRPARSRELGMVGR